MPVAVIKTGIPTASMTKNTIAHILAPGNWSTTCGYVMNTKPGPLSTTSLTVEPWDAAIKPNMLNVITLGMIDVSVLITQVKTASLRVQHNRFSRHDLCDYFPSGAGGVDPIFIFNIY